jgi:hypothetical protein
MPLINCYCCSISFWQMPVALQELLCTRHPSELDFLYQRVAAACPGSLLLLQSSRQP